MENTTALLIVLFEHQNIDNVCDAILCICLVSLLEGPKLIQNIELILTCSVADFTSKNWFYLKLEIGAFYPKIDFYTQI